MPLDVTHHASHRGMDCIGHCSIRRMSVGRRACGMGGVRFGGVAVRCGTWWGVVVEASCRLPLFGGGWCNEGAVRKLFYVASNFDMALDRCNCQHSHGVMQRWTPFSSDVTRPGRLVIELAVLLSVV